MTSSATDSHADVQRLCRLAGLPRATYYRRLARQDGKAADCELRDLIQRICLKHNFYGYRRVTAMLKRQGMVVNAKKVQRLMREDNLLAQRKTPFLKPPTERPSSVLVVPNLIRGLVPSTPDQIWVTDITYVHLAKAFAYLAVILDAFPESPNNRFRITVPVHSRPGERSDIRGCGFPTLIAGHRNSKQGRNGKAFRHIFS
jgi:putative transposase